MKILLLTVTLILLNTCLNAQSIEGIIQGFLDKNHEQQGYTKADVENWQITSHHKSKQSGATHVYIQQIYNGIPVSNGVANFAIKDGKVYSLGLGFVQNISQKSNYSKPKINPSQAIRKVSEQLGLGKVSETRVSEAINSKHYIFENGGISQEQIPVKLMYHEMEDKSVKLVWDLSLYTLDSEHWWSVRTDASNGEILDKIDWVTHCRFDHSPFVNCTSHIHKKRKVATSLQSPDNLNSGAEYNVFALPLESPNHGVRTIVTDPADSVASPYGWHDTNASAGADYTITRGNNVYAYEDTSSANSPGYSPDGGPALHFNFPYNIAEQPEVNLNAAISNLFYMNNMMHDIWYRYGFDEASGNFQQNNYGNGGQGNDYVRAEALDGSGTNNANFATPTEGNRPRMQMYIWPYSSNSGSFLEINSPSNIAGSYFGIVANFGPELPAVPITSDLVLIEDNTVPVNDGCQTIVNTAQVNGKIVLIDMGVCAFVDKVQAAQDAGATAVLIANSTGFLFPMAGSSSTINIPSIMITAADANAIKAEMLIGTVNVSLDNAGISDNDSDFDNGIIAHEYGHGISKRLCGGPANSGCLSNQEQMGEGWSDWFGLMLTMEPGDMGTDVRGIGTYVKKQATDGDGIRPAPYSTDFAVNNYTYAHSNNTADISQPHGVGFIFATALWDLNWALIDFYGGTPDPDWYNGTGGNNIAMQLIIEGLKLQPCSPGMIDGRDAILLADQLLYGGAHKCLIWEVFRKRGFGYSADQGSTASRTDQTEAFDISPVCLVANAPPVAAIDLLNLNSCVSTIHFTDSSSEPHQWLWDFGDNSTSILQNPTHSYINDGTYNVKLIVSNNLGTDSVSIQLTITLPDPPIAISDEVCAGDSATLTASGSGIIQWLNLSNTVIYTGDSLPLGNVGSVQTYYAENTTGPAAQYTGAVDSSIGSGAYENTAYHGALNFTAEQQLEIASVWVEADGAGIRTFFLSKGTNTDGMLPTSTVDDATVYLNDGPQRVNINLMVPDSGDYYLGANDVALFRNTAGANYPYTIPGYLSITSSSDSLAASNAYYYFYDWEVREPRCVSIPDTAYAYPVTSYFTYTTDSINTVISFFDGSSGAVSWLWHFGDGDSSTQQNPIHNYAQTGTYNVTLSINNGNCISVQTINMLVNIDYINHNIPKTDILPNPSAGQFSVRLDKAVSEDLIIQISGSTGRILQTSNLNAGETLKTMDISQYPSGMYIVRIQGFNFTEIRKLIRR